MRVNEFRREIKRLEKEISKLPTISEESKKRLDLIADLLADKFFARKATGTLPKRGKRGK